MAYLGEILGQWDFLLLNLTSIGFMNFLDVSPLIFYKCNDDVVTIKDETSKENS